jgi:hypothetical protein
MIMGAGKHIAAAAMVLSGLMSSPAAAQTADRFDLLCVGLLWDMISGEREDATIVVRIDLATRRFCFDDCDRYQRVYSIADPGSETIAYDYDVDKTGPDHHAGVYRGGDPEDFAAMREHIVIHLDDLTLRRDFLFESGDLAARRFHLKTHATCTRAPFGSKIYNKIPLMRRLEDYSDTQP